MTTLSWNPQYRHRTTLNKILFKKKKKNTEPEDVDQ
jgi:hypothetical protein